MLSPTTFRIVKYDKDHHVQVGSGAGGAAGGGGVGGRCGQFKDLKGRPLLPLFILFVLIKTIMFRLEVWLVEQEEGEVWGAVWPSQP